MKKHFIAFLFFTYYFLRISQFTNDFSYENIKPNPDWLESISDFEVDTPFKPRLNDAITKTSCLSVSSQDIIKWESRAIERRGRSK